MGKTLVIGANGQIGKLLVKQLRQQQAVRVMLRDVQQASFFTDLGAEVVDGDLEQTLPDHVFTGCDQIVFTAGSGGKTGADKTILVDLWGACKSVDMAKKHHAKQFIMVSAQNAGDPENSTPAIKHYNVCKHFADNYLIDSGLPYTVLRPGRLTDEPANERITTQRPADKADKQITRADVALAIIEVLGKASCLNRIYELYQGQQTIAEALC
jgi:uncharacterized protein YbjT (DUF2867 family)